MEFSKKLKLILDDFEYKGVRVVFLKDYPGLPTPSGRINVKKGDEVELPRWQARILEDEGLVTVKDNLVDVDQVNMYHYQEKRKASANMLISLPQDFYLKVREYIRKIDREIASDPRSVNMVLLEIRETVERNLIELAEARLLKIIRLALTSGEEFRERMTPEESLIYEDVSEVASTWRRYIASIFRGEFD